MRREKGQKSARVVFSNRKQILLQILTLKCLRHKQSMSNFRTDKFQSQELTFRSLKPLQHLRKIWAFILSGNATKTI